MNVFFGSFCQINRVTDEALIAETKVWPNSFLMNVFFALKGSILFIIIITFYTYFLFSDWSRTCHDMLT